MSLAGCITMAGVAVGVGLAALGLPLEGGAIAVLAFVFVYVRMDRTLTPGLLIGPSSFAFLYHALGYSIGPLAQRYILGEEHFIEEGMVLAQWGAVLGLVTYAFVYRIIFSKTACRFNNGKDAQPNASPIRPKWEGYTVLLLAISGLLLIYGHLSGGMRRIGGSEVSGATYTVLYTFLYVQYVVFFFLGVFAVKRRGWWIVLAVLAFLGYAVFQTLEGNRGQLISSGLMLATGVVWAGFSIRKALLCLFMWGLILIPLAGVVDFYRSTTSASQYDEGFLARITVFSQAMQGLRSAEAEESQIATRAFIYAVSAITVDRVMVMTPDIIPHALFEKMDALFYIYIPAFIAPNRPDISDGSIIAAVYGVGEGKGSSSWFYIPSVGEGYRRFGWLGIPLIYGLSGIIFGGAIAICWTKRQKREWAAMLVFLVLQVPAVWSFTFNYLFYFALSYLPKYYIYFAGLRKLQDVLASFHKTILRRSLVKYSGDTSLQGGSS